MTVHTPPALSMRTPMSPPFSRGGAQLFWAPRVAAPKNGPPPLARWRGRPQRPPAGGRPMRGTLMANIAGYMTPNATLAAEAGDAALAGRVWLPEAAGPAVAAVRDGDLYDISAAAPTMRDLAEMSDPAAVVRDAEGVRIGALGQVLANTP